MLITTLDKIESSQIEKVLKEIEDIFFLSTSIKEFSSPERKAAFFKRWCGDYIALYKNTFYVAVESAQVLGYLSCCLDSKNAEAVLEVPGYSVFNDFFDAFPAHLHINFHPDARGKGLGSLLVNRVVHDLINQKIAGLHLVTSPDSANVTFYTRLGFDHQETRELNQMKLLFMGKKLIE
jgi:ribosomal protein S18 acetylase RimI-like enzyme